MLPLAVPPRQMFFTGPEIIISPSVHLREKSVSLPTHALTFIFAITPQKPHRYPPAAIDSVPQMASAQPAAVPIPPTSAAGIPGALVMPGDIVDVSSEKRTRLGLGLLPASTGVSASTAGVLKRGGLGAGVGGNSLLWVDAPSRRYRAQVDDMVVGTIVERHAESYRVDIGLAQPAVLPALAFEGASKRNKPVLDVGQLMYARVRVANKHLEAELTCISPHVKKDWVTQDSIFGPLQGGTVLHTTISLARALMADDHPVLALLGKKLRFELAIGANGRVWVNAETAGQTIIVVNILSLAESKPPAQLEVMLDRAIKAWGSA